MQKHRLVYRFAFRGLEIASALVFFSAVAHHVVNFDLKPLATLAIPLLMVFYGFASVLFARGRAMAKGPWQTRSLYAAERAMQATVWHLCGILLGLAAYALLKRLGVPFDPTQPSPAALWLLLFLVPYAFMQIALLYFMRGLSVLVPDFFQGLGTLTVARRIRQA